MTATAAGFLMRDEYNVGESRVLLAESHCAISGDPRCANKKKRAQLSRSFGIEGFELLRWKGALSFHRRTGSQTCSDDAMQTVLATQALSASTRPRGSGDLGPAGQRGLPGRST